MHHFSIFRENYGSKPGSQEHQKVPALPSHQVLPVERKRQVIRVEDKVEDDAVAVIHQDLLMRCT